LQNTQQLDWSLHVHSSAQRLYCKCEVSSQPHVRSKTKTGGNTMERFMRSAIGIAVAIGTSGLMFAVTLA
jgi:predicted PolB exonuclease-like 3'-5' exonuclease